MKSHNSPFFLKMFSKQGFILLSIYLFFLIIPSVSFAQYHELNFQKIPIEIDGVSYYPNVYSITQDHSGFLWLSTNEGLIKYDGYQFKIYKNIPGDSTSINSNNTQNIYVDYTGDLWIGTDLGLSRYVSDCDCFFQYMVNPDKIKSIRKMTGITEDKDGELWVGREDGGLFHYERETDSFTRHLNDPKDPNAIIDADDIVWDLLADRQNHIWIAISYPLVGNFGGLMRYDPATGFSKRYMHEPNNPNSLIDNKVTALLEDRDGRILVGTAQNGLHYYDRLKDEFVRMKYNPALPNNLYPPKGNRVWESSPFITILHEDRNGGFWVGTCGGGIHHFDPVTNKVSLYVHDNANPNGISNEYLWSFFEDRSGQLWLGNLGGGGLHKMDPFIQKITIYTESKNAGLRDNYESKREPGIILLSTYLKGLLQLDLKTGKTKSYFNKHKDVNSIIGDRVHVVYEDSNGLLWIGFDEERPFAKNNLTSKTINAALGRFDPQTGKFSKYMIPVSDLDSTNNPVYVIHEDREGYLWLSTGKGGLFGFDRDKEIFKRYKLPGKKNQSDKSGVYFIEEDSNGTLWIGDTGGEGTLFYYNRENDSFQPFLEGYKPLCFYEDSKGQFWMGTQNNGLLHFNPDKSSFQQYTMEDGLPSNLVKDIQEGPIGIYWLFTSNGISKFEAKSKRFLPFAIPRFPFAKARKGSDGQIFFGGNGTLYSFFPNQVSGNFIPPELILNGLKISGKSYDLNKNTIEKPEKIILTHLQNDLSFEYTGIHYSNPSKNLYKYKLEPYDLEWIEAGTQRMARYTNLDPGEYNFRVIGSNDNDVWNEKGASIQLLIKSAWWTRWWAYIAYACLAIGLIVSIRRYELNRILVRKKAQYLSELDTMKTNFFTNITHEFRTPLTVILGMTDNLKSSVENLPLNDANESLDMIQRNGETLLRLVNEMLELAKLESGKLALHPRQSDVIPYVKYLCESFHSYAQENQINLVVYTEIDRLVMDFDSKKLETIILNLLSNAIKFTQPEEKIIVHLNQSLISNNEFFIIKVKDTGIGISEENSIKIFNRFHQIDNSSTKHSEGTGIGLSLTKELVELMHGTINVKSSLGKGSEFTVHIPITKNAPLVKEVKIDQENLVISSSINNEQPLLNRNTETNLPLVLIIEDNQDVAYYLKSCLKGKYETLHAKNGDIGIEMAYKTIPDIIICDVMMPGKDGFEVCATLKSDELTDHIPIIMLTAKATIEDRLIGLSYGADAYLAKPFVKAELFTRLDQLISLRKKILHKFENNGFYQLLKKRMENPETKFIQKIINIIHKDITDHSLGSAQLARKLHLSESQVYRKLKAITGKSTSVFIRSVRLQKGKEMIQTTDNTISEIAYAVGFNDPSWFSRAFKEEFGFSPSAMSK